MLVRMHGRVNQPVPSDCGRNSLGTRGVKPPPAFLAATSVGRNHLQRIWGPRDGGCLLITCQILEGWNSLSANPRSDPPEGQVGSLTDEAMPTTRGVRVRVRETHEAFGSLSR